MDNQAPATEPRIYYLPKLINRVASLEIQVPDFQRPIVWKEKDVLQLLESVYSNFPIGSLLLWQTVEANLRVTERPPFPDRPLTRAPDGGLLEYVLDGQQRLATLYGCLKEPKGESLFTVHFDLVDREFRHGVPQETTEVPMQALFHPVDFSAIQLKLLQLSNGEKLATMLIELRERFQNYEVPTVRLSNRSLNDVAKVFERVNNTGQRLTAFDFLRALTWSEKFDLDTAFGSLTAGKNLEKFSVAPDELVKAAALILGRTPDTDGVLQLRDEKEVSVRNKIRNLRKGALKAITMFKSIGMPVFEDVPYAGQFIVAAAALSVAAPADTKLIQRWVWRTTFQEYLGGNTGNRLRQAYSKCVAGGDPSDVLQWRSLATDLATRLFIPGRALTRGFVAIQKASSGCTLDGKGIDETSTVVYLPEIVDGADRPRKRNTIATAFFVGSKSLAKKLKANPTTIRDAILRAARDFGAHRIFADADTINAIAKKDELAVTLRAAHIEREMKKQWDA